MSSCGYVNIPLYHAHYIPSMFTYIEGCICKHPSMYFHTHVCIVNIPVDNVNIPLYHAQGMKIHTHMNTELWLVILYIPGMDENHLFKNDQPFVVHEGPSSLGRHTCGASFPKTMAKSMHILLGSQYITIKWWCFTINFIFVDYMCQVYLLKKKKKHRHVMPPGNPSGAFSGSAAGLVPLATERSRCRTGSTSVSGGQK